MDEKIVIVTNKGPIHSIMFSDLKNVENVIYLEEKISLSNPILRIINKVHESRKVRKLIKIPYRKIWYDLYNISKVTSDSCYKYKIIFTDVTVTDYTVEYLKEMKKKNNIELNLLMINPLNKPDKYTGTITNYLNDNLFHNIYTFDEKDAKKYGFIYETNIYSQQVLPKMKEKYDLLFVGNDKGRAALLYTIYKKANLLGLKCKFIINNLEDGTPKIEGIEYNRELSYLDILKLVQESKALLEILQEGQGGATFRTYEAICYNKILVTNNQYVVDFPMYNERYVQIITNTEEISFQKIENYREVDYNYQGEFSPIHFICRV